MEKLLKNLGIDETAGAEEIVRKLELKQSEIMERLDNVEDEKRKQKLEGDLKEIEAAVTAFSWMRGKNRTGIAREDAVPEDFSDLRGQGAEERKEEIRAEQGNVDAQIALGLQYYNGEGVAQDYLKAAECFQKVAEQGFAGAQNMLGYMYQWGQGVAQDYVKAVEWYQKAAEQGIAIAQYNLGFMYEAGNGVAQDSAKAVELYQKAVEQGYAEAQRALGVMCYNGDGVARDHLKAAVWFQKAAEQGDVIAQRNLGIMYANGEGIARDYLKAAEWYQKAAEQGDALSQYYLGVQYFNGMGVAQNRLKATEWWRKAAEQGFAEAKNKLANMGSKEQSDAKTAAVTQPAPAPTPIYTKSTAPAPAPTYTKNKPPVRKGRKFIKRLCISVLIIMAIGSACPCEFEGLGIETGFVRCFSPNILYAEEYFWDIPALCYVSLRPMKCLQINESCKYMSYVIVPFGVKQLLIHAAIKKINIHDGTKYVNLNCERLKELTIPDSVTELSLYNLKDELALTLELPEHLKSFSISASPDLTDAGFQAIKITEAETVSIANCGNLKNINISGDIEKLVISSEEEINVKIDGNVQTFQLTADTVNVTVNGNGYLGSIVADGVGNLIVNGKIDDLQLEQCHYLELGEAPKELDLDYDGDKELILPEGIERLSLDLRGASLERLEIPDGVKSLAIYWYSGESLEIPDGVEYLAIYSDSLESLEIPDGVKYLEINSDSLGSLKIPDGVKYLEINSDSLESLKIPDGVRWLYIYSNTLDFDSLNISEDILYYQLVSRERNDSREYQAENCPEELLQGNYDHYLGKFPDLSAY